MALVEYSDSEEDEVTSRQAKKRKLHPNEEQNELPPLPAAFHDFYSSTVRTSSQDDPSLHGGRRRVTPHVEGAWPTHVYLEWHPKPDEIDVLSKLVDAQGASEAQKHPSNGGQVHSLLFNDLGVSLPLHVSLSRPLTLRTEQRHDFLAQLQRDISSSGVRPFNIKPASLDWHSNESQERWFLVLRLERAERGGLCKLLKACNSVANNFGQPLLYQEIDDHEQAHPFAERDDSFHISIAWSLSRHVIPEESSKQDGSGTLLSQARHINLHFSDVKVRIGQAVTTVPLVHRRS